MNKYLEALERLKTAPTFMGGTVEYQSCTKSETLLMQDYEIVKQALNRLEAIEKANPSKALEFLEEIKSQSPVCHYDDGSKSYVFEKEFETIKQALLKAEKEHKVFEIIKEKECDMSWLKYCIKENLIVEAYNSGYPEHHKKLTEEEFNTLKEVLE